LEFILTLDVDWVALSFVQRPEDMEEFRALAGNNVKIMAKLEKPSAIEYLDEVYLTFVFLLVDVDFLTYLDRFALRWHHGGKRRLGRGDVSVGRADHSEANCGEMPRSRQARSDRHSDDGEHDRESHAYSSRGF
jgi:hypothetical protein